MEVFKILIAIIIGYLLGSIPWALVIGKLFYKTDVRKYGSHNLGGTNVCRVINKKAGYTVIFLDASKAFFAALIVSWFAGTTAIALGGFAAAMGHCYPLFANFKGGKAVSSTFGYLIAISILITHDPLTCIVPGLIFFMFLGLTRMVSVASMVGIFSAWLYALVFSSNSLIKAILLFLALFVIYRHKKNINRIINKKESKIRILK